MGSLWGCLWALIVASAVQLSSSHSSPASIRRFPSQQHDSTPRLTRFRSSLLDKPHKGNSPKAKPAQPRFAQATAAQRARLKAQILEHQKEYIGAGADPWWLKNPPWFLPPPPSWGPMPPTEYNEYYRETKTPPGAPNEGPIYTKAQDLEPPFGSGIPLKSKNYAKVFRDQEDFMPPIVPRPLTAKNTDPGKVEKPENPYKLLAEAQGKKASGKVPKADPTEAWAGFAFLEENSEQIPPIQQDSLAGPQTIGEHLIDRQVIQVPDELRYDRHHNYGHYWHRYYQYQQDHGHPYEFKFAPQYPPHARAVFPRDWGNNPPYQHTPGPHPSWWMLNPSYPSKYFEATAWQMKQAQRIRMKYSDPAEEQRIREVKGVVFPYYPKK